ncbi:hypothetical protein AVEN_158277-1 [Araneus ventricosus]|uniref:Uncharacterized protein n=1 Tax=Araneus ventricosus TaxID=182803 RepID=A0A4Y2PX41_ARAVE|nr:hypothetical protein AVEN_158277-1 [Araneus ventricosus]
MTLVHHTISSHNLPVAADICRNVALIARCPDDRKSLLGAVASCLNLVIAGKLFSTQMFLELAEHVKFAGRTANGYSQILCNVCDAYCAIAENNVFHPLHHV